MDNSQLVDNIKKECKKKGLTVRQLELTLGYGSGNISRFKTTNPSINKVVEIAKYFDVSVDSLLYGYKNEVDDSKNDENASKKNNLSSDKLNSSSIDSTKNINIVNKLIELTRTCYSIWDMIDYKNDKLGLLQYLYNYNIYSDFDCYCVHFKHGDYLIIAQYNDFLNVIDSDIKLYALVNGKLIIKVSDYRLLEPLCVLLNNEFEKERCEKKMEGLDDELLNL